MENKRPSSVPKKRRRALPSVQKAALQEVQDQKFSQGPRGHSVEQFLLMVAPLMKVFGAECGAQAEGEGKQQAVDDWRAGKMIPAAAVTPENGVDVYCYGVKVAA